MLATTIDMGIPPAWNSAVMEIRKGQAEDRPRMFFGGIEDRRYEAGNAMTTATIYQPNSIDKLDWTAAEALETYLRLRTFAEDWDAPGMEVYDDL